MHPAAAGCLLGPGAAVVTGWPDHCGPPRAARRPGAARLARAARCAQRGECGLQGLGSGGGVRRGVGARAFCGQLLAVFPTLGGQLRAQLLTELAQLLAGVLGAAGGVGDGLMRRGCVGQGPIPHGFGGLDAPGRLGLRAVDLLGCPVLGGGDALDGLGAHRGQLPIDLGAQPLNLPGVLVPQRCQLTSVVSARAWSSSVSASSRAALASPAAWRAAVASVRAWSRAASAAWIRSSASSRARSTCRRAAASSADTLSGSPATVIASTAAATVLRSCSAPAWNWSSSPAARSRAVLAGASH